MFRGDTAEIFVKLAVDSKAALISVPASRGNPDDQRTAKPDLARERLPKLVAERRRLPRDVRHMHPDEVLCALEEHSYLPCSTGQSERSRDVLVAATLFKNESRDLPRKSIEFLGRSSLSSYVRRHIYARA